MNTRPIEETDLKFIHHFVRVGLDLLKVYGTVDPEKLSPVKIGQALDAWQEDASPEKEEEIEVINGLGSLYGHYVNKMTSAEWVVVVDQFGITLGLRHNVSGTIIHPLEIVSKRTQEGRAGKELVSIYEVFAEDMI